MHTFMGFADVDECRTGKARCEQICTDLIPGFQCGCNSGYRLNQDGRTCRDVDECSERLHTCSQTCINNLGGYICACHKGYIPDPNDDTKCIDVDECAEARLSGYSVCQFDDLCQNLLGTYQCGCPSGLILGKSDPRQCVDIDECLTLDSPCPNGSFNGTTVAQICDNVYAGYKCSCLPGTKPDSSQEVELTHIDPIRDEFLYTSKELNQRYIKAIEAAQNMRCIDIDECASHPEYCQPLVKNVDRVSELSHCKNTFRSYECVCDTVGFNYDPSRGLCFDIDECSNTKTSCYGDPLATCKNLVPGYECECPEGWAAKTINGKFNSCIDIDECAMENVCGDGVCVNLPGSYLCQDSIARNHCDLNLCSKNICTNDKKCLCSKGYAPIVSGSEKCGPIDSCILTNSLYCGEGYSCADNGCRCWKNTPPGSRELTNSESVALAEQIGSHVKNLPLDFLNVMNPLDLFIAFATLPPGIQPWIIWNIDWSRSTRFTIHKRMTNVVPAETKTDIIKTFIQILLNTHIKRC